MRIVGGSLRGRRLTAPEGAGLRPTSDRAREALFNILLHGALGQPTLAGSLFLDLFAGTGAVACEALSRGASNAVLVENDRAAAAAAQQNLASLGLSARASIQRTDATRLGPASQRAQFAFLDPPYRSGLAGPALTALAAGGWLDRDALTVVEVAAAEPFDPPAGFDLVDERRYGAARLLFLTAPRSSPS